MSISRQDQITNLMWQEVALKGTSATLAFGFFAIVVYFYKFGLTANQELIKATCLFIIAVNLLRLWISKKIDADAYVSERFRNLLRVGIGLNALGWGIIFGVVTVETEGQGIHFPMMVTLMTGYITASIITLSYDKTIYFPFQILVLAPMCAGSLYLYFSGINPTGLIYGIFFGFYFFYQFRQYRDYRRQLIQRFNYQIELKLSYEELKRNQEAFVEQTAKLMHASKISALGEMAGGLAHEVNNSLMVILGSSQQIERQLRSKHLMDQNLQNKIDQSTNSIMKIKTVIEGLKHFSLQMEPTPKEATDLNELISRTLHYCQELLNAHNVRFDIAPIPEILVKCQPFQIIQVLFNLTKNADDAIQRLKPEEKWVRYEFDVKNGYVYIKVKNGGPTIKKENINRLFQPFFTTKDVGQGTGLSLSISKGYAMDHKGDLYYDAEEKDTTFVLKLPIA